MAYSVGNGSIFKPVNVFPQKYIDAVVDNIFTCTICGSKVTTIELDILDSSGDIVETYVDNTHIYYNGDTFSYVVPANTLTNKNTYSWYMVLSNTVDTNMTLSNIQSDTYQFYTLANPVVTINSIPSTVTSSKYQFKGTYSSTNYIPIKTYQFILTDNYGYVFKSDLVDTSENIIFDYESLQDGCTYTLQLNVEATNGVKVSATPVTFTVSYSSFTTSVTLITSILCDKDAVQLSWSGSVDSNIIKWNIQRKEIGYNNMVNLCHINSSTMTFIDYSACNGHNYKYYLFPETNTETGVPVISNTVSPNWFNWSLTDPTGSGKVFIFNNNLTSDTINNEIDRTEYETFTKYNKVSKGLRNYYKSKITSLAGDFDTGKYNCTNDYINDLRSVINNNNMKFIKDRRGNLYIGDCFNFTVKFDDNISDQPITISFEYQELQDNPYLSYVSQTISVPTWNFL